MKKPQKSLPRYERSECPTSRCVLVRSLRRRLWKALQEEDVATAMRAYLVTKSDYELWLEEEICEEDAARSKQEMMKEKKQQERRDARPMALKKLGSFIKTPRSASSRNLGSPTDSQRSLKLSSRNDLSVETRKAQFLDEGDRSFHPSQSILQSELHPNDAFVRDDFYGPFDSYDLDLLLPPKPKVKKEPQTKFLNRGPRLAGFMPWRSASKYDWGLTADEFLSARLNPQEDTEKVDESMTTLLHEASRLASAEFVRLLLRNGGNPNVRNGMQRTALHMIAGGLSELESQFPIKGDSKNADVGIRAPIINLDDHEVEENIDEKIHQKAARAVSRIFTKSKQLKSSATSQGLNSTGPRQSNVDLEHYASQRMDTLLAILSWCHPDDNTPSAGEGPTVNSVDIRGRAALHYAAEMGRTDLCLTILTSFGAILTIVDEAGQTPGELAAEQNHPDLAAQLEARALLYTDPYGLDEDLFASVWEESSDDENVTASKTKKKKAKQTLHSKLVPPFSWYETWTMDMVRSERQRLVAKLFVDMRDVLSLKQNDRESLEFMYNHGFEEGMDNDAASTATGAAVTGPPIDDDEHDIEETEAKNPAIPKKLSETRSSGTSVSTPEEDWAVNLKSDVTSYTENLDPNGSHSCSQRKDAPTDMHCFPEESLGLKGGTVIAGNAVDTDQITVEMSESPDCCESKPQSEFLSLASRLEQSQVEQFLAFHSWNTVTALNAFQEDPIASMKLAGMEVPSAPEKKIAERKDDPEATLCLICCDEMSTLSDDWVELGACNHAFCSECLGSYISECARSRDVGVTIKCPHHECSMPLSSDEVEKLVQGPEVYECLLKAADEKFVASSEDLCFCPYAGCEMVVRKLFPAFAASAKLDRSLLGLCGAVCTGTHAVVEASHCPLTYEGIPDPSYRMTKNAIQPRKPHRFCFACVSETIHWPIQCDDLEQWKEKIANEIAELDEGEEPEPDGNFNDVAQRLWMKANTRPCPKCKAPIEKNDGCNHMTCSNRNCRHEFCWICREDWKLHNTETGGFFRCNRWQADDSHQYYDSKPPEERAPSESSTPDAVSSEDYGTSLHASRTAWKKSKDMGLFLHNYRRWIAHKESAALERQMADTVCTRLAPVVEAAIDFNGHDSFDFGGIGLSFIHAAFTELLECRSLLQHSYAFAFFRYPIQYHIRRDRIAKSKEREKLAFEQRQSELEMLTEQASDIVARRHLRATQMQIMFVTKSAFQKRRELTSFMLSLLNEKLKESKADAERAKREKSRPTVDRVPSIFDLVVRDFPLRQHHQPYFTNRDHNPSHLRRLMEDRLHQPYQTNRDHESSHLRRLMEDHQLSIRRASPGMFDFVDFDDQDEFRLQPGRIRTGFLDEDSGHDVGRPNMRHFTPFMSDDIRNTNNIRRFQDWACSECTYMNAVGRFCAMCGTSRR